MIIKLHPEAEKDLEKVLHHYAKIDKSLEDRFLEVLELTFDKIVQYPHLYPYENSLSQKVVMDTFPYIVLYEKYEEIIMILAIFHTKRNPKILVERV